MDGGIISHYLHHWVEVGVGQVEVVRLEGVGCHGLKHSNEAVSSTTR